MCQLGGPDLKASAPRVQDAYGAPIAAEGSYKYFGAAKDLPGIRELFEKDKGAIAPPKKTRGQLVKGITPDYFGWRDDVRYAVDVSCVLIVIADWSVGQWRILTDLLWSWHTCVYLCDGWCTCVACRRMES